MLSPSWGKLAFSPSAMRLSHAFRGSTPVRSVTIGSSSSRADADGRSGASFAVIMEAAVVVVVVVVAAVVVVREEHDNHNHGPAKERTSQPPSRRRSQPAVDGGVAPSPPSPADAIDDHAGPDNESSRSTRMDKIIVDVVET